MKIAFTLALLALVACGKNGDQPSTPPEAAVSLVEKKDCVATPSDIQKLVGTYPTKKDLYLKVADWALTLAHDQDCTINDDAKFFGNLKQHIETDCSGESCEIKLKNGENL